MTELMFRSGLLGYGGGVLIWMQIALLVILTAIIVYRRDVIVRLNSYRAAFLMLCLSFIVPAGFGVLNPLMMMLTATGRSGPNGLYTFFFGIMQALPPLLIGLSMLNLFRGLVPKFIPPEGEPVPPEEVPRRRRRPGEPPVHNDLQQPDDFDPFDG